MLKINIYNKQAVISWSATFETQELANAWKATQIQNNSWGKPQRVVRVLEGEFLPSSENLEEAVSSVEGTDEFDRNYIDHSFDAEYTIEQSDITTEINIEKLRAIREPKLKRCDQLINIAFLNAWTASEKTELKNYRQALLDITEPYKTNTQLSDEELNSFVWPTEPTEA